MRLPLPALLLLTALARCAVGAVPALAAAPSAEEPATVTLPTPLVVTLLQTLGQRPYAEVWQLVGRLQQCVAAQMPNASVRAGECADLGAKPTLAPPPAAP